MTGHADYWAPGDWNTVCSECGRKFKASEMKRHWQGYYVCSPHWEARQPQDFARAVPDNQTPPWVQPMPADVFLDGESWLVLESSTTADVSNILTETYYPISTES